MAKLFNNKSTAVKKTGGKSGALLEQSASFSIPVVEEPPPLSDLEKELVSVLGRIEVVLLEYPDENGAVIHWRLQIVCLPSESAHVTALFQNRELVFDDSSMVEKQEAEASFFEQIANSFMESCVSNPCQTTFPKSALRKSGEEKHIERNVTFDRIDIHEFNMTLGDHPSAVSGPPMALDWERGSKMSSVSLDEYEHSRRPRRNRKELKIPLKTRVSILQKEANFSADEITRAWEQALLVRKQRRETLKGGVSQMVYDEFWESANRKWQRVADTLTGMIL